MIFKGSKWGGEKKIVRMEIEMKMRWRREISVKMCVNKLIECTYVSLKIHIDKRWLLKMFSRFKNVKNINKIFLIF